MADLAMDTRDGGRGGPPDGYRRGGREERRDDRGPRPQRRRSRSPPNIDRYQPGQRGDDNFRQREDDRRRRQSPPTIDRYVPGEGPPPPVPVNDIRSPFMIEYQVGFSYFAEWWRADNYIKEEKERQRTGRRVDRVKGEKEGREEKAKERDLIQVAYDAYKEKLQVQMARAFVLQHQDEEWFKERYNEDLKNAVNAKVAVLKLEAYQKWCQDLEAGVFDNLTLEGIYKSESNGSGGVVEKEEGEAVTANEVLGVLDLLPTAGGELRDEATLQPTLLIKTIAPTVSRDKMEAFCAEHLGVGSGGFRGLSLSDPNPTKKYHRIGWIMLHPTPSSPRVDNDDENLEEDEEAVKAEVPTNNMLTARTALEQINGKTIQDTTRGDFTCHVGIHEPPIAPRKKALWDLFSAPERVERDLQLAIRLVQNLDEKLGEGVASGVIKVAERVENLQGKGWLQPPVVTPAAKKEEDAMDEEEDGAIKEEGEESEEGAEDDDIDDEAMLVKKKQLDLLVEYLRRVHNFCLFCVFESDSVHELTRKCPAGHLRRPRASLTSLAKTAAKASASGKPFPFKNGQALDFGDSPLEEKKFNLGRNIKANQQLTKAFNWVKTYEDKLIQLLDPESVDLRKIGGKPVEEGLDEELKNFVKQEDESKFRCKVPDCAKLFKGQTFWKKHVEKRHVEWYANLKQGIELINSYVLDPAHIAPSRSDANSNGHFPISNNHNPGTPRGFNLNAPFMQGGQSGPLDPSQIAAFMAQHGMSTPWMGGPPGMNDHSGGARRNGPRFGGARAPGPYDRNPKDARNARWGPPGSSGRLSPVRNKPTNPRFDGGLAAMGPREAVQGRALKSYEDLDAAGPSTSSAALDY